MNIAIISGTNRIGALSLKVARRIESRYKQLGATTTLLNLQELPLELFAPQAYKNKPEEFAPFQDAITNADGVVIVVPEYNGSFPGVLKYFIDMLKFPESFEQRPVAYVGIAAGMWGGLRAVEQLQGVFGYRNGFSFNERVFVPNIYKQIKDDGSFHSELIEDLLEQQTKNFLVYCESLLPLR